MYTLCVIDTVQLVNWGINQSSMVLGNALGHVRVTPLSGDSSPHCHAQLPQLDTAAAPYPLPPPFPPPPFPQRRRRLRPPFSSPTPCLFFSSTARRSSTTRGSRRVRGRGEGVLLKGETCSQRGEHVHARGGRWFFLLWHRTLLCTYVTLLLLYFLWCRSRSMLFVGPCSRSAAYSMIARF